MTRLQDNRDAAPPRVALIIESAFASGRRILEGIAQYAHGHGPWSIFYEPRSSEPRIPRWLQDWDGDGIITRIWNPAIAEAVVQLGLPAVDTLGMVPDSGVPLVHVDNGAIARCVVDHFVEQGYREFACCTLRRVNWAEQRQETFVATVEVWGHACAVHALPEYTAADGSWEREQDRLARWIVGLPKPVGLFAVSDNVGLRVLEACRRGRVAVPDAVAVVGVDNDETICRVSNPPLSSVNAECQRVGFEAARVLDAMMQGRPPPGSPLLIAPSGVVVRYSSDVLAIEDPLVAQAVRIIREHACDGIDVEDLVQLIGTSRTTLKRRFKEVLRRSVHDEINTVRLNRVKQLLMESNLPLKLVAKRSGFHHATYMTAVFRKGLGLTPGQYRQQNQKKNA